MSISNRMSNNNNIKMTLCFVTGLTIGYLINKIKGKQKNTKSKSVLSLLNNIIEESKMSSQSELNINISDIEIDCSKWFSISLELLKKEKAILYHFVSHSHHLWPNISLKGHLECWMDAGKFTDLKWDYVFSNLLPKLKKLIIQNLGMNDELSESIAFASNTHELYNRVLSCLPDKRSNKKRNIDEIVILTTNSEFHSFNRQTTRLEEEKIVKRIIIDTQPFHTFESRFIHAINKYQTEIDLIYLSHVFFDSGFRVLNLEKIINTVTQEHIYIIIDGYHAFMAVPLNLKSIENRVFYLAGGYKYAMSGENCCFMTCPNGYGKRPLNTGWFAGFGELASDSKSKQNNELVPYSKNGSRFLGSTMDNSGFYRMHEVLQWMHDNKITVKNVHNRVLNLHSLFLNELNNANNNNNINNNNKNLPHLLVPNGENRGRFLTFITENAGAICKRLETEYKILTDSRGNRLRIGFGLYHNPEEVKYCARCLSNVFSNFIIINGK